MIDTEVRINRAIALLVMAATALVPIGCQPKQKTAQKPAPEPITLAVAPAMNLSGAADFDPAALGDIMASELALTGGVRVVGVSRVLAMMAELGLRELRDPVDAIELSRRLGTDGILVFAITEYDPYDPPVVGITGQVYMSWGALRGDSFDPVSTSRAAKASSPSRSASPSRFLRAEVQRVFNGSDDLTATQIKLFAQLRRADRSPYSWRKYLASQTHFLRYCCHSVARELLGQLRNGSALAARNEEHDEERIP